MHRTVYPRPTICSFFSFSSFLLDPFLFPHRPPSNFAAFVNYAHLSGSLAFGDIKKMCEAIFLILEIAENWDLMVWGAM